MTTTTSSAMTAEAASMILRRAPQGCAEWRAATTALATLKAAGMGQAAIEREIMRELGYAELVAMATI